MEAGRELDALVGERVMGLAVAHDMTVGDVYRYHPDGDPLLLRRVPDYSTDIASAWLVVERMAVLGYLFEIGCYIGERRYALFYKSGDAVEAEPHDTVPVAICLTALATVSHKAD